MNKQLIKIILSLLIIILFIQNIKSQNLLLLNNFTGKNAGISIYGCDNKQETKIVNEKFSFLYSEVVYEKNYIVFFVNVSDFNMSDT